MYRDRKEYFRKYRKERAVKRDKRTIRGLFIKFKYQARLRGREVTITLKDFQNLASQNCYYCDGILPLQGYGIDRIDNSLGYIPGNVASCCSMCNISKGSHTIEEFKNWIFKVYRKFAAA